MTGSQPPAGKKARGAVHRPRVAKDRPRSTKRRSGDKPARKAQRRATAREGTKKEKVLALLRRSQGATLTELMKATGWQSHSVRGFLSGALRKKMKLKVKSSKRDNGERVYSARRVPCEDAVEAFSDFFQFLEGIPIHRGVPSDQTNHRLAPLMNLVSVSGLRPPVQFRCQVRRSGGVEASPFISMSAQTAPIHSNRPLRRLLEMTNLSLDATQHMSFSRRLGRRTVSLRRAGIRALRPMVSNLQDSRALTGHQLANK